MSGTSMSVAAAGAGEGYFRPLFTAVQLQELKQQAMIYKYLVAGLPVPPDLVVPIRRSLEVLSARFFHHPSLGYCSYYGKKYDPEPGRCRRTDGKKWRCTKDAYPDSKYCERHMHRGRNRSRKPVESQTNTSQSLSSVLSHVAAGSSSGSGSFQSSSGGSFQNLPFYSISNSEGLYLGTNVSKLQMDPVPCGINTKEFRYLHGFSPDGDEQNFSPEGSGSNRGLGIESGAENSWRFLPSQIPSSSVSKLRNDSHLGDNPVQLQMLQAFEPMIDASVSKQRQQHCLFGSEIGSSESVKQDQQSMRPFFNEWPKTREWSNFDDEGSNKNIYSTTQLSISIPMEDPSEFSSASPNDT